MKISDGFDARRLRPKAHRDWGSRLVLIFAALLILCGVLLLLAGAASLIGRPGALGELNASPAGAALVLVFGLLVSWLGVWMWRRRRRLMRKPFGLNMAPHLMKKHD
ncbi:MULTISPECIES: hypothetical protein [Pseudomonas]|jgi:uncharacterized membrane protein YidH (DUF202 family)|uniref:Uncharacterized protein n=2 Tax=Pseudomonas TaxID=286 RepID=A0A9Q6VSD6_PSEFR|nr:hypothetical protein [Pseudomonas fragi]MBM1206564.1 hypothetical protein [Pseudomonas fragi]MDE4514852.1 hypothetical protein [Pseudomonas fragi]NNA83344.1 hypothetical protein [Pseudomonas fragi]NNB02660.1 hypothetical protein [Pseudomonas fragi]NNB07813.1 hypothetical protein [Pseudomonas fragi]